MGEFKHGLKDGKGKWRSSNDANACTYEGEYRNDKKHGEGAFVWSSGNTYTGQYGSDYREGIGKMTWIDGSTYEGEWRKGI